MPAQQCAALAALTRAVVAGCDIAAVMQQAVTSVAETLEVAHSAVWELRPERRALALRVGTVAVAASGEEQWLTIDAVARASHGQLGTDSLVIADWPAATQPDQPPLLRAHGIIRSLYVLIPAPGRPRTYLGIDTAERRIFSAAEIAFAHTVANVLSLACERSETQQMLEQQVAELAEENCRRVSAAHDKAVLEERHRLARELHDSVTQALYGVTLHAAAARRQLAVGDVATALEDLRVLQTTAQEALDEMRLMIFELRPPVLEQVGLVAALQARLNAVEGRSNLETRLIVDESPALPLQVEEALYRIAREALTNVLKHAHARRITVSLHQVQSRVELEISDDGLGFVVATAYERGGMGLRGMAERAAQLNGTFTLESTPGAGTRLRVEIHQ